MKKTMLMLAIALGMCAGAPAQEVQKDVKGQVVRGLMNVVKHQVDKRRAAKNDSAAAEQGEQKPAAEPLMKLVEEALSPHIAEVKERYKEAGRGYARELGDVVAERILANPQVKRVLTILEVLGGVLAAYLSVVTLKLLSSLRAIRKNTEQLLKAADAKRKTSR